MSEGIIIYSKDVCPYCIKAKNLFDLKKVPYTEINLSEQPEELATMLERSNGARSVPQIFINGQYIGGCDDLYLLDENGKLDALLDNTQ